MDLGNTWVYTSISYAGYDTQTITMTATITDTVVEVQWQPPFFAARVVHEYKPDQLPDGIEENDWADYLGLDEWTDSEWYVISGTYVYNEPYEVDFAKLRTEIAAHETGPLYVLPLSEGDCWDPSSGKPVDTQDCWERLAPREVAERLESSQGTDDPGTRVITVTYSTMTQDYYQDFDAQIELSDCAPDYCECFLLITWYNNGAIREWFCSGVGSVGGFWNHAGTPFGGVSYLIDYTLRGSISATATPTPTPTATPISPQCPLADFPLNLGNTWVYSYTEYATIYVEAVSTTIRTGYLVTETIVETRLEPPFFAAKMRREQEMIAPPANLAEEDWPEWLLEDAEKTGYYHYWRVISGTQVYSWRSPEADRGPNLSRFNPSKEILEFVFPLSPNAGWHPLPEDRKEPLEDWVSYFRGVLDVSELETAPDGTRYCLLHITRYQDEDIYYSTERVEFTSPTDTLDSCFLLAEGGLGPPRWEWFCPGIGIAGGYYHHHVLEPFGDESILIDYSFPSP